MRKSELLRSKTKSLLKFSMYLFVFVIISTSFTNIPKTRNGESENVSMSRANKKSDLTKIYTRKKNTEGSDSHILVLHFIGKYVQYKYELDLGENIQKGKFVEIIKNGDVYYYLKDAKGKVKKVFMCSGNDATIFELNSKNEKVDTLYLK